MKNKLYEDFHKDTRPQSYLINERNYTYGLILKLIQEYIQQSANILDIGCGSGSISLFLASKGKNQVLGIDISDKAIQASTSSAIRLSLKNIKFKKMDFLKDTLKDNYDIILCFEVIEHLEKDKFALKRIFELLKPKGILILSTPSLNAPLHRIGYAKAFDRKVGHLRRYNSIQLIELFKEIGYEIVTIKKTEGILRNFLYLNNYAGKLIRFIKFPFSVVIEFIDNIFLTLFGESDIIIVARKP